MVDFDGWKAIDAAELSAARAGRLRRKIKDRAKLFAASVGARANQEDLPS